MLFVLLYKSNTIKENDWLNIDSFIKNTTTESAYQKNAYFKKWDLLDYISFINFWDNTQIWLDLSWIKNNLDIDSIYINDIKKEEWDLNNLNLKWMTIIKIVWKAKINNLDGKIKQDNLIKINVVKESETKNTEEDNETDKIITKVKVPNNISLINSNFSSNINNLLQIKWNNLDTIDYVNIWWFSIKPQSDTWVLLVSLDKNIFASWEYFLFFQLKNWEIMPTENKITFVHSQQKINIANLTPTSINNTEDRFIVIQWNWFKKIISVQLNNNMILKGTSFNVINDNVAAIKIPKWLTAWLYYFNIMDTDRIYELKDNTFNITN